MKRYRAALAAALVSIMASAAGAAAAADAPAKVSKEDIARGMKEGPAVISALHITCTLTDARFIGTLNMPADPKVPGSKAHSVDGYEFACKEGLGYSVLNDKVAAPFIQDCLSTQGHPVLGCRLPENADPKAGLAPLLTEAGRPCDITAAKGLGATASGVHFYEVACKTGNGYIIQKEPDKTAAFPCIGMGETKLACSLTTPDANKAYVKSLAAGTKKTCAITDVRFVGSTTGGLDGYEAQCSDNGYMFTVSHTGEVKQTVDCALASSFLGGCKLTDATKVETAEAKIYTDLAKKAGFPCEVSKYRLIGVVGGNTDLVEIACSNRPDGGVGAFGEDPSKSKVMDCLQVGSYDQECKLGSSMTPIYTKLSQALASKGKGSCVVSGARYIGQTDNGSTLIETACADGGLGWVIKANPTTYAPEALFPCAAATGATACKLPSNMKK